MKEVSGLGKRLEKATWNLARIKMTYLLGTQMFANPLRNYSHYKTSIPFFF